MSDGDMVASTMSSTAVSAGDGMQDAVQAVISLWHVNPAAAAAMTVTAGRGEREA